MPKTKVIKTRKDHKCNICNKKIGSGSIIKRTKLYPAQAKSWGLIDVNLPMTFYYCGKCDKH